MKKLGIDGVLMIIGVVVFLLGICLDNSLLFLVGVLWLCALVFAECCGAVVQVFKNDTGDSDSDSDYYDSDTTNSDNIPSTIFEGSSEPHNDFTFDDGNSE